jgi:hypothetical protein
LLSLKFAPANDRQDRDSLLDRHVVAYDGDGVPSAYGWRRGGEIGLEVPEVASFHLPAGGASLTAIPEEPVVSEAVLDAYYGTALPLVIQAAHGLEVLHGSAVLVPSPSRIVAFCGTTESGKSTIACGLATRGYSHWADDAVAFRVDGPHSVTAVGLPFTVKLRESSAAYFRSPSDTPGVVEEFEWVEAPLAAVFLLEPIQQRDPGEGVAVERLVPVEAFRGVLPNAFRFQPQTRERKRQTIDSYLDLVASAPVLSARFPNDLDRLPGLLDELERWIHEVA